MSPTNTFIFCTCQVGAERALKQEFARDYPAYRFAFSRPGFVTFKAPDDLDPGSAVSLPCVFARAYGVSLGKATAADPDLRAEQIWRLAGSRPYQRLHVWQRDLRAAGDHGYEPGPTELAGEAERALMRNAPAAVTGDFAASAKAATNIGDLVLDVIVVEPDEWWVGWHQATTVPECWPGGLCPVTMPADGISRAYLKMEEGLLWSGLPVKAGEHCAEIGCAPGGASLALLKRGLQVMGIDPAEVDSRVAEHPHFVHVRKRGADVRRREFRKTKWLFADMNVAPQYTLDTVQEIVTHADVDVKGMLLTLKLLDWKLAAEIPAYIARVQGWGFHRVDARQLQHNRQEVCLAARRK